MISERQLKILDALIGEYVFTAEPVGSQTLVRRYSLGVSSATVRSELAALEDGGYVTSPHVSAGRIPTDNGYREFVDWLLRGPGDEGAVQRELERMTECAKGASEIDELISGVSMALTAITHCLAIIAAPKVVKARPKRVTIVPLASNLCTVVVVMQDGSVLDRRVGLPFSADPERLRDIETRLNEVFDGRHAKRALALAESDPAKLAELMGTGPLSSRIIAEVAACMTELAGATPHRFGLADLLAQPEFASTDAAVALARLLESDVSVGRLLDGVAQVEGVVVRIGHENGDAAPTMSVVATAYGADEADGLVAVVGPTRMDYAKAMAAVRAAALTLEATLA